MKTRNDKPQIRKIKEKNVYPDPVKEKQIYKYATNVFREFARQEEDDDNRHNTAKQLIHLVQKDNLVSQFIDLLYKIKHKKQHRKTNKEYLQSKPKG